VPFAKHYDVVKTVPSNRADQSFSVRIIKGSQLRLVGSMGGKPSGLRMSSIRFTGVNLR